MWVREAPARRELAHVCTHRQRALRYCNTPLSRSAKETAADAPGKHGREDKWSESGRIRSLPCPLPKRFLPPVGRRNSHQAGAPGRNSLFPSHLSPHRVSPRSQVHLYTPSSESATEQLWFVCLHVTYIFTATRSISFKKSNELTTQMQSRNQIKAQGFKGFKKKKKKR